MFIFKTFKITPTGPRRVIELDNDFRYVTTAAPPGSYLFANITLGLVIIEKMRQYLQMALPKREEQYSTRLLVYVYYTTNFELSLPIK